MLGSVVYVLHVCPPWSLYRGRSLPALFSGFLLSHVLHIPQGVGAVGRGVLWVCPLSQGMSGLTG